MVDMNSKQGYQKLDTESLKPKYNNNASDAQTEDGTTQSDQSGTNSPAGRARRNFQTDKSKTQDVPFEFGGPIGVTFIIIASHLVMYWCMTCVLTGGRFVIPKSYSQFTDFIRLCYKYTKPNWTATVIYVGFNIYQAALAMVLPGPKVLGLPIEGGQQLEYKCNGVLSWYIDLALTIVLHYSGLFPLTIIVDNIGALMTVAILCGDLITVITYVVGVSTGNTLRMTGSVVYDMFMGAILNPRIKSLDLKMWSEIRIPWKLLFFITLSAAIKEHELVRQARIDQGLHIVYKLFGGSLTVPIIFTSSMLLFMLLAHTLYCNACMKGEECIPTTWDIFYEKWGYMLIFWNFAGVPFSYCYSSLYILQRQIQGNPIQLHPAYVTFVFVLLLFAYYVWDTANSQKNWFRMQQKGTFIPRKAFPQLPFGLVKNPEFIQTAHGNKLLVSGWWKYAKKIHYTADLLMALSWGLITGFSSVLPYFYVCFFTVVLVHRVSRDMERCSKKYGRDWDEYCKRVPYTFIPYVY